VGILIRAVRTGLISKSEGLDDLEKLAEVMWLSVDVYGNAIRVIEGL